MKVTFKTKKIENTLKDAHAIQMAYGALAKRVSQRMDQLRSFQNLSDLISYQAADCHSLTGEKSGEWVLSLYVNFSLIFEIVQEPIPKKNVGLSSRILIKDTRILEKRDYYSQRNNQI